MEYMYDSDLLTIDAQIIAQQCNCVTSSGKGLSADIAAAFPHADFYSERTKPSIPGTIEARGGRGQRWVLAMYAQYHPGAPSQRSGDTAEQRIEWFKECLARAGRIKNLRHIAFPEHIGCGLAKGDWEVYHEMLATFSEEHPGIRVVVVSKNSPPNDGHNYDNGLCGCLLTVKHNTRGQVYAYDQSGAVTEYWSDIEDYQSKKLEEPEVIIDYTTVSLVEYTQSHLPEGWEDFFIAQLDPELGSLPEISTHLEKEAKTEQIFPPLIMIYTSFRLTRPKDIKVVIIGQDPYHGEGQAMGIAFSVPGDIYPPPSLKNMYKELESTGFEVTDPENGDLTKWCDQGVFLVNTALTVRAHTPKSHSKKWIEAFTPSLLRWLNDHCDPLVVILWGNDAQALGKYFGEQHRKIQSAHPSPLSASRGFFESDPFRKANKFLKELGKDPIDWSL